MAKALVSRIVKGPKPIHGYDADGKKRIYGIGDKIELSANAAEKFAKYLVSPEVARAEANVAKATADDAEAVAKAAEASPAAPAARPAGGDGAKSS